MTRVTSFMVATWRHSKNLTRGAPSFPIFDRTPPRNSEKTTIPRMFMPDALVTLIVSTSNIVTPVTRLNWWRMMTHDEHTFTPVIHSQLNNHAFKEKWPHAQLMLIQNAITIICVNLKDNCQYFFFSFSLYKTNTVIFWDLTMHIYIYIRHA